jgi:membrane protein insertase Oxa1/YidC/SpoIIIJ
MTLLQEDAKMYPIVLTLHSLVRWAVVILAVTVVVRAFVGWFGKREWASLDERLGLFFSISVDVQLLLGLLLYFFLSPLTTTALKDFGAAMSNPVQRFFTVDHVLAMAIAVVLVHVGRALSRKAAGAQGKHRLAAILYGLAVLAIVLAIPWPFEIGVGRPLLRLG